MSDISKVNGYRIEYLGREGPSQNYRYAIWLGARRVAEFGHDFRNDERWVVIGGVTISITEDMLSGGGPEPLFVSAEGMALLDRLLKG